MKKLNLLFLLLLQFLCIKLLPAQTSFSELNQIYDKYYSEISENEISKTVEIENFLSNIPESSTINSQEIKDVIRLLVYLEKSSLTEKSRELLQKLIPEVKNSPVFKAFLHQRLATHYLKKNEAVPALENYLKASFIYEKEEEPYALAFTYKELSKINLLGQNYQQSLTYGNQAYDIYQEYPPQNKEDSLNLRAVIDYKGLNNRKLSNHQEAINNFNASIEISKALNDTVYVSIAKGNKAVSYFDLGELDEAEQLLREDYNTSKNNEIYGSAFNAGLYIAEIYQEWGQFDKRDSIFKELEQFQKRFNFSNPLSMTEYYSLAASVAESNGNYSEAIQHYKALEKVHEIKDSLAAQNNITKMQEKYLLDKEISKLDLLVKTNNLQASHLKLRTAILIIIAIALLVVLWYLFTLRSKNKKIDKLNEMLEAKVSERTARLMEINKELDTYLYRASHDIRRPIRTLLGLNNIAQINSDTEQMKQLFTKVHATAMSMDKMLFKLQMAYELNNSHEIEKVEIDDLIQECIDDMALEIEEHKSKINVRINEGIKSVQANKALLRIALDNIIENALLYQKEDNSEIEVYTDEGNYFFYIHVKDNGFGIPEKYLKELFKPYFKISNKTQGSGLGLFLAHKAISFLEGEIAVKSTINEGSQFTLKIPINPK